MKHKNGAVIMQMYAAAKGYNCEEQPLPTAEVEREDFIV